MKCDRCGNEIPSGLMFCPECGRAVQMVPDFDVNIDEGIAVSSDEVKEALDKLIDSEGNRRLSDDTVRLPAIKGEVSMFRRAAAITAKKAVIKHFRFFATVSRSVSPSP